MSLVDRLSEADERILAASGVACMERCFFEAETTELLRPVWLAVAAGDGEAWLTAVRTAVDALLGTMDDETSLLGAREIVEPLPAAYECAELLPWTQRLSVSALAFHQELDGGELLSRASAEAATRYLNGDTSGIRPLTAGELRRQAKILDLLTADEPGGGLRQVLALSTEGKRVLRAAVSRRARVRG